MAHHEDDDLASEVGTERRSPREVIGPPGGVEDETDEPREPWQEPPA